MPNYVEIPLHLSQVLEEELENLPDPPAGGEGEAEVLMPAAVDEEKKAEAAEGAPPAAPSGHDPVKVSDDWYFREGHVKNAAALAALLKQAADGWAVTHEGRWLKSDDEELKAEPDLYTFLAFRYRGLWDAEYTPGCERADLDTLLNQILRDEDECGAPNAADWTVFNAERLGWLRRRRRMLRRETRALLELTEERGGADVFEGGGGEKAQFGATDLARFRRLLLEDVFPGALRRAYDLRLSRAVGRLHTARRSAVCFSGGGIRSGTFALGVIQSLAKRDLLNHFDYLSTVSGGGYIGGWLTAWIHRHPDGLKGVIKDFKGESRLSNLEPEPEALTHLRDYSNFITPRSGLLSADTWTFIVIYVRNLLLNWVVLLPLLASVLMIPRVVNAVVLAKPAWRVLASLAVFTGLSVWLLKPKWKTFWVAAGLCLLGLGILVGGKYGGRDWVPMREQNHVQNILGALLAAGTLLGGYVLAFMRLGRPSNSGAIRPGTFWDRHRDQTSFLWLGLLPLALAAMLLTTFWVWFRRTVTDSGLPVESHVQFLGWHIGSEFLAFLVYGAALGLASWLLYSLFTALSWSGATREVERMYKGGSGARQRYEQAGKLYRHAVRRGLLRTVFVSGLKELFVTLAASLVGAVLLYVAAVKIPVFYDAVVCPFRDEACRNVVEYGLRPYERWYRAEFYTLLAFPVYLFVFFLGITLFTGFTSRRTERPPHEETGTGWRSYLRMPHLSGRLRIEDEDREWLARASAWVVIAAAGWFFLGGLVIFGPLLFVWLGTWLAGLGGASGLFSLLGGRSPLTPGNKKEEARAGWLQTLGFNLVVAAAFVFCCIIIITVSLLAGTLVVWLLGTFPELVPWVRQNPAHFELFRDRYPFQSAGNLFRGLHFPSWLYLLLLAFVLQVFGRFFGRVINLNKFSLHAGYRDRIIRAFLGASQPRSERQENLFTGFDPRDNLYMQELRPGLLREADFREPHALGDFVAELNRPLGLFDKVPEKEDERGRRRRLIAKFLRERIQETAGESLRYFKDPPDSIEFNPSFRAALFGDLNRVIQKYEIPDFGAGGVAVAAAPPAAAPPAPGEAALIEQNRARLNAAFEYIEAPPLDYRLMHVVNMALNLVGGDRLAWQQRRAESFTATPLHAGGLFIGYRRTRQYGGTNGISLGTAVAISGAAASSNMGYFSPSVFVTFVLTFFNARLGWWLGNPGASGSETYFRSHPESALSPIIDEAFGLTDDDNPYVLLSDGGHFENLGLYEMVLRRCRHIVVVDGSADPAGVYDDLGSAVRKIRIDFGIPIEFAAERFPILSRPESETKSGGYYTVGDIHYEAVDDPRGDSNYFEGGRKLNHLTGKLVYVKPAVYFTEPRDIFNYAKGDASFPHESTADQFFDEPQFESHRMLGFYIFEQMLNTDGMKSPPAKAPATVADLVALLETKSREDEERRGREKKKKAGEKKEQEEMDGEKAEEKHEDG